MVHALGEVELHLDARLFEGRVVAVRWRLEARRSRRLGRTRTSIPLLIVEERTEPVVRVETSPLGTWRVSSLRGPAEEALETGPCSVRYEQPVTPATPGGYGQGP